MRRQAVAFALVDAAFLADQKFRALARRLPDADAFNSAVGAWLIALADARRAGSPVIDVPAVTGSRFGSDLVAVGLISDCGFPPKSFADWAPMSPQQASAGRARAEQADAAGLRDNKGRFLISPAASSVASALDALVPLDQRRPAFPSPPIPSTQLNEESVSPLDGATPENGAAASSPHTTVERPNERPLNKHSTPDQIVRRWLTDHGASQPKGFVNTDLNELVKVHGHEPVIAVWAKASPDRRTSKEWVKFAERSLSPGNGTKPGKSNGGHGTEAAERAFDHG
jgi:hypothetical protein